MDNAGNKLESGPLDLLTELEVARILRRPKSAIERFRMTGKLTFFRGRPVLIARADLREFLEAEKVRAAEKPSPAPACAEAGRGEGVGAQTDAQDDAARMISFDRYPERWPEFLRLDEAAEATRRPVAEIITAMRRGWLPYLPWRPIVVERNDLLAWSRWTPEKRQAEEADYQKRQSDRARAEWLRKWRWRRYIRGQRSRPT